MLTRLRRNITLYSFKPISTQVADHDALHAKVVVASQQPAPPVVSMLDELFRAVRKIAALMGHVFVDFGFFRPRTRGARMLFL